MDSEVAAPLSLVLSFSTPVLALLPVDYMSILPKLSSTSILEIFMPLENK